MDRKIKARERELIKQIQKEYDAVAPVQDIRAQLEGVFRKARRIRRIQARESGLNNAERPLNAAKSESKSDSSISYLFPIRCQPYQYLYYLGNTDLPLEERLYNLGSKYSL